MKIVGIVGSVFGSKTKIAMESLNFSSHVDFEIVNLADLSLDFADGRDFRDYEGDSKELVQKILDADALVIGTPIFQASIPGALKNVLDLLPIDSIKDKPVAVIVTAGSEKHFLVAQYHLLPILSYMKASVIEKYVFIDSTAYQQGNLVDDDAYFRLRTLVRDLESRVVRLKKEHEARYNF